MTLYQSQFSSFLLQNNWTNKEQNAIFHVLDRTNKRFTLCKQKLQNYSKKLLTKELMRMRYTFHPYNKFHTFLITLKLIIIHFNPKYIIAAMYGTCILRYQAYFNTSVSITPKNSSCFFHFLALFVIVPILLSYITREYQESYAIFRFPL